MFDFLTENISEPLIPEVVYHGPNAKDLKKMDRKGVIQDFMDVYQEENGKELIRIHMKNDPKSFFEVLKKLIPNNYGLEGGESLQVSLIDRYGNELKIESSVSAEGQSASDAVTSPMSTERSGPVPNVTIKETFGTDPKQIESVASNTPDDEEFDFTL